MRINKQSLQARIDNLVQKENINPNDALRFYFFDEFIKRLAKSPYHNNFVLKGGFYLSSLLGIKSRATTDVDFMLRQAELEKENLKKMIQTIAAIPVDDGILFAFLSIQSIREEDPYGGYRVTLLGKLENIRQPLTFDIATGDPITPAAIVYSYQTLIDKENITCWAYNLETFLAEKLQTIFAKAEINSRCKDYYDVYVLWAKEQTKINPATLRLAFQNTCAHRQTFFTQKSMQAMLDRVSSNADFLKRWNAYTQKRTFAKDLSLEDCLQTIRNLLDYL